MRIFRKFSCLILVIAVLLLPVQANASQSDTEDYIQRMIQYYLRHQEAADEEIAVLLDYLCRQDPRQGELWRRIMVSWAYTNSQMPIHQGILPDGLAQDDSLCIVIMGYGLREDGTMREELIDRLVVGLSSALKYPNAYVVVTGGGTSAVEGITEAGQMAQWLMERGVSSDRLIVENRSYSTLQNATKVYAMLQSYPQITDLAVITSDYHIRQSCTLFSAMCYYGAYQTGTQPIRVVSCAVNTTGRQVNDLHTQAWGICAITGIPYDSQPETQPELSE